MKFPTRTDSVPKRDIDYVTETPIPNMRSPFSSCSLGKSKRLHKHYRLLLLPLFFILGFEGIFLFLMMPYTSDTGF